MQAIILAYVVMGTEPKWLFSFWRPMGEEEGGLMHRLQDLSNMQEGRFHWTSSKHKADRCVPRQLRALLAKPRAFGSSRNGPRSMSFMSESLIVEDPSLYPPLENLTIQDYNYSQ